MKKDIHPAHYRPVLFVDINNDAKVLTRSTIQLGDHPETATWTDGNEYPVVRVPISSASHSFYTNQKVEVDEMGTIAKFNAKYKRKK